MASNRNPSCGTITTRERSDANRTSVSGTPDSSTSPPAGSISRVSSLANVVLPLPVSPTTATRVRAGIVQVDVGQHGRAARVGKRHVVEPHDERARRQVARPPRPGRPRPGAMSSTSSTRRQPATAFCASLSTSVAICTGWMNSVTRNRNAVSLPTVSSPPTPSSTPTTTTAASARPAASSPVEKLITLVRSARCWAGPLLVDRGVEAARGAAGDPVRPDDRRADDALGDRAEQRAGALRGPRRTPPASRCWNSRITSDRRQRTRRRRPA